LTIDLFTLWTISISWNIFFLVVAGLYLYTSSRAKRRKDASKENREQSNEVRKHEGTHRIQFKTKAVSISRNFIFVWILLGLLVFYIFSVKLGTGTLSELVFALGNIIVEALLVFYLFRNRDKTRGAQKET
jgi:hypothetical protein